MVKKIDGFLEMIYKPTPSKSQWDSFQERQCELIICAGRQGNQSLSHKNI